MSTTHGTPPWDGSPTPPLAVFEAAAVKDPNLPYAMATGHLVSLLGDALGERNAYRIAAEKLATDLAELQEVAAAHDERKRAKREYMRDFRAARAAQRAGIR